MVDTTLEFPKPLPPKQPAVEPAPVAGGNFWDRARAFIGKGKSPKAAVARPDSQTGQPQPPILPSAREIPTDNVQLRIARMFREIGKIEPTAEVMQKVLVRLSLIEQTVADHSLAISQAKALFFPLVSDKDDPVAWRIALDQYALDSTGGPAQTALGKFYQGCSSLAVYLTPEDLEMIKGQPVSNGEPASIKQKAFLITDAGEAWQYSNVAWAAKRALTQGKTVIPLLRSSTVSADIEAEVPSEQYAAQQLAVAMPAGQVLVLESRPETTTNKEGVARELRSLAKGLDSDIQAIEVPDVPPRAVS